MNQAPAIKICGLKKPEHLNACAQYGAQFAGFVFYPQSPRHLNWDEAKTLAAICPPGLKKVALLVNPDNEAVMKAVKAIKPDYIQLHGHEDIARLQDIKAQTGLKIIKAVGINTAEDIKEAQLYEDTADIILLDAKAPKASALPGGNGTAFDWQVLKNAGFKKPVMLSGGLTPDNIGHALKTLQALNFKLYGVDTSSGVEIARGEKSAALIKDFCNSVRSPL